MFVAALIVAVLLAWAGARQRLRAPERTRLTPSLWLCLFVGLAVGFAPLARIAVKYLGAEAPLVGDARSHAIIANAIATRGAPHGFVDVYQGGFPLALHYPIVGWLADAALIKLGLGAPQATSILGLTCCALTAGLAAWFAARLTGSHTATLATALFLSSVSPSPPIAGGVGTFIDNGVLSQVVATPIAVAFLGAVFSPSRWLSPMLLGPLLMSAHPQIGVATLIVAWVAAIFVADRRTIARCFRGTWPAVGWAALVYGPGIATLKYPFGWPDLMRWHLVGFGTTRFEDWFADGRLFDDGREPWLTALMLGSLVLAIARVKQPAARALLASAVAVLVLTAAGPHLDRAGSLGRALLTFAQPMRVLAMFPLVGAALVAFGAHTGSIGLTSAFARVATRPTARRLSTLVAVTSLVAIGWAGWPALRRLARERDAQTACPWDHRETAQVIGWLRKLDRGRLFFDERSVLSDCAFAWGFDAQSAIPIATSSSAGAHVGDHFRAFHSIAIGEPGGDRRAQTLGVRFVLAANDQPPHGAFVARATSAHTTLWEREGGTDLVGLGCVAEAWTDGDTAARGRIKGAMKAMLSEPARFVALAAAPTDGCSPEGSVTEHTSEPGTFAATIDAPAPTMAVIRATTHPFWTTYVDGRRAPRVDIFPGFIGVSVGAGKHELTAEFRWPTWLLLALCGFAALTVWRAYSTSRST